MVGLIPCRQVHSDLDGSPRAVPVLSGLELEVQQVLAGGGLQFASSRLASQSV